MTKIPERALFAYVFEAAPEGNILVDQAGVIVLANRNAERMFGYEKGELAGLSVELLVPDSLRGSHIKKRGAYTHTYSNSGSMLEFTPPFIEHPALHKDGSSFPIEISLNPIHAAGGMYVLSIVRDISARQQREFELRHQGELVQLLLDIAITANGTDTVYEAFQFTVNRVCQYMGWPLGHAFLIDADAAKLPIQIWSSGASERYGEFIAATEAINHQRKMGMPGMVLESGQPVWLNDLVRHSNFLRQEAALNCNLRTGLGLPILVGKDVAGVLEFFHEEEILPDAELLEVLPHVGMQVGRVIERKRAEEALRKQTAQLHMVMTNLPVILWVVNSEGQVLLLEGKGVNISGVDPQEFVGKSIYSQLSNRPELKQLIQRALQGEEMHTELISGTGDAFETFITPYFDADLSASGVIGLSFDVSERKRMEGELEEMRRRLMESSDAERYRLAQMIHDGPLQDLYGAFYQIQDVRINLEGQALETASRAMQTIQAVNATLRVICGELHPNTLVHLGLQRAIRGHAERLQERLDGATILLDLEDDTQPEKHIPHNLRMGLYRVFQQLLINATRHSRARNIWVRLKIAPEQVVLEVQDNGRGFDAPEQWISLLREGKYGLVTALERVRNLDGKLEILSRPEEGALVRVTIPRSNAG